MYGLILKQVKGKQYPVVIRLMGAEAFDLNEEKNDWLRGYLNDPASLSYILR